MTDARFPWWVPLGGVLLALGYLPSLTTNFDFTDDGNLVYPAPAGTTLRGYAERYADKVAANVEHLGPFRPAVWLHWELTANALGADPVAWRTTRMLWCGVAAAMLLWLMRELRVPPPAALVAAAAAMWNPYRNEIWTSLTLAEGVAMPYALLALVAARRAATSPTAWRWDVLSMACVLVALGCKNTFVALIPAQVLLRLWPDGVSLTAAWRANRWRALALTATVALPAAHFVYFKLNWHPGQYQPTGPSLEQLGRFASWLKGTAGLDFLAVGLLLAGVAAVRHRKSDTAVSPAGVAAAGLLILAGTAVYLPMTMMAGRYTMPAVWGVDLLIAVPTWDGKLAWAGVGVGVAAMMVANVGRQEKLAARSDLLWAAVRHLEQHAPKDARVAFVGGDTANDSLNVEEGIHLQWHLTHRGRGDIRVGLVDADGALIVRTELPPLDRPADFRVTGAGVESGPAWQPVQALAAGYRLGTKSYAARIEVPRRPDPSATPEPWLAAYLKDKLGSDDDTLRKLRGEPAAEGKPTALLTGKK